VSEQEEKKELEAEDQGSEQAAEAVSTAPEPAEPPGPPPAKEKRRGGFIAWLALLLALALVAASGYSLLEAQKREATLLNRLAGLEAKAKAKQTDADSVGMQLQRQLDEGVAELESQLTANLAQVETRAAEQTAALERVDALLAEQRVELARFSASDREDWLLAEAEYLLRLANQRLIMTGDVVAAQALLSSADAVLRELDDVGLHGARAAVAADIAALRAVPRIDTEGVYLRLAALIDQAGGLVIFEMPDVEAQPAEIPAEDWQGRLRQGYEAALHKLSDYIIIRRRDVPMQALMDPQWEGLVRQNLRMLLEQAQVALLSGNQLLYGESLQRAEHWVAEFLESDEAAAKAVAREIAELRAVTVAIDLPDISRSLRAVDEALATRLQRGDEG
jgi:uroporphyrin-3 C-methyltransferase